MLYLGESLPLSPQLGGAIGAERGQTDLRRTDCGEQAKQVIDKIRNGNEGLK